MKIESDIMTVSICICVATRYITTNIIIYQL